MYEEGTSDKGVNTAKAQKWYLEASKYGNKKAVARLKVMAEEGRAAQEVYLQACANLKMDG